MCVVVCVDQAIDGPSAELDLDELTIHLASELTYEQALILARRLLARVGAHQPDDGVACWCGDRVDVGAALAHS